jgi:hypothetical protein
MALAAKLSISTHSLVELPARSAEPAHV